MGKQFRGIRPEDMTKLQQIAEMMSRDSEFYARKIADSIEESVAKEVAEVLVKRSVKPSREYRRFADDVSKSTNDLLRKLSLA